MMVRIRERATPLCASAPLPAPATVTLAFGWLGVRKGEVDGIAAVLFVLLVMPELEIGLIFRTPTEDDNTGETLEVVVGIAGAERVSIKIDL
jgi:hypothetical protein